MSRNRWKSILTLFSALSFMFFNVIPAFADGDDGDLGKVIGRDDRTRVTNTKITPYAQTVRLMVEHANGQVWFGGTGVMISPDTVLSAAHVLYENGVQAPTQRVLEGNGWRYEGTAWWVIRK